MKRLTTEEWIERAKKVHGDKYDYSKSRYLTSRLKICIICPIHGEFWQEANSHLQGEGCPKCKGEKVSKRNAKTTEQFIEEARKIHGDKYDYSKVEYERSNKKVCIICSVHGEFWQTPNAHLQGSGCPSCAFKSPNRIKIINTNGNCAALRKELFIEKAINVHGNKYDYSKVEYTNNKTEVCIICPIHGEFWQRPDNHLHSHGCYKCGRDLMGEKQTKNTELFIEEARKIHGDKYDYSKVKYTTGDKKVCIICPKHGEFWQTPDAHLQGSRCPYCKESKLEVEVENILSKNDINYIKQCRKSTLEWLDRLSLDFYLPKYNIAIECQGKQHFRWNGFFGGEDEFNKQIERDNRKIALCLEHGVKLIYYSKPSLKPLYEVITNEGQLINIIKKW